MKKTHSDRRKEYNSDKTSVQIPKDTHLQLKLFCKKNGIKVKDFLNDIILSSITGK